MNPVSQRKIDRAGKERAEPGDAPPATRKRRVFAKAHGRSRSNRPSERGPVLPPQPSLSRHVEDWRAAADEVVNFLKLAREPGGMIAKVSRLAAKLEKKGYVAVDRDATDLFAGFPAYRIDIPLQKRRPTWNDARDASQRLPVFLSRHFRRETGLSNDEGDKHYHVIKPTPDRGFFTQTAYVSTVLPGWATCRVEGAGLSVESAMGGAASTGSVVGGMTGAGNALGGLIDAADQLHAFIDMKSAAKKAAIEIVTSFHALLKVMCHEAGEECAAVPTDAEWIAASQCRQAFARHPKFGAEMSDMSLRCLVATWRDVGVGAPSGLVSLTRIAVGIAAAADGANEALSAAAGALGDVSSGGLAPIGSGFDMGHSTFEHKAWGEKFRLAKDTMAWLKAVKHLPVNDEQSPEHQADRALFNTMLPACWQAHHDIAKHAKFMKRCSYVRFFKGVANSVVAWPLWVAAVATGVTTLGTVPAAVSGSVGTLYLISMGAKLGRNACRKRDQKNDQQAADILIATQCGDGLRKTVRKGWFKGTATRGTFVGGGKVFAGKKTHRVDVQLSPAMGLACFATLVDKIVRDKPLDPEVHVALMRFMIKQGVTALELSMIKQSVLAAARMRKAADAALDDEGDEWHRLLDLQNQLGPCFGLPRGATKLSDGVFLESFFGARLAQRAQSHAQQHPECQRRIKDCLDGAGRLMTEPAQGLELLSRVASNLAEAAPSIHYSHCSDAEMQGIADQLFPGIPPQLFLEKCEHLLAMADQAWRTGDHFEWQVDGLPMHDLAPFCRFVREQWNRDVNATRSVQRALDAAQDEAGQHEILASFSRSRLEAARNGIPAVPGHEADAMAAMKSAIDSHLQARHPIEPEGSRDSYVRRMAVATSDRYPLPWNECDIGFTQRLNDREGFALMINAEVERCMEKGSDLVPAEVLDVLSVTDKHTGRPDYRELLKREESGGDGSRPVINMLLMKQADDLDRLVMPDGPGSIAQIGTKLAARGDGLQLQQSRWNASKDRMPQMLQWSNDLGVCFKRYARDGRLRHHSVMVSRARNGYGFRVYDPATGKESRLLEAPDMGSAIKQYIAMHSRGRHVDSAALDFVDLFRVQARRQGA
ncbi:hypothetical protein [Rhizobacter sp. OV335]|uniref:hypothetical protein n=1 Tax=Rhizobacter sp. OV335 TaxID=1500264 RepID=UPI0009185D4C|nr:hypothetical protein [Rhizobacter sp. OV335]SHM62999.1 hypothetical protein SAMN02787076_01766 [Rhizobacter sp. OV335]